MVIITDFSLFFNAYRLPKRIFFSGLPKYFCKSTCILSGFVVI